MTLKVWMINGLACTCNSLLVGKSWTILMLLKVSVKSLKNLVRCRCRSSHLWSGMPGQGSIKTLLKAFTINLWSSGSNFKWFKQEYKSVNSLSFQIDGGRTVPVKVQRKWAAEWTNFNLFLEPWWSSLITGETATMILEVRSLHWGSKVGSLRARLCKCESQWHQAFKAAKACECLKIKTLKHNWNNCRLKTLFKLKEDVLSIWRYNCWLTPF